MPDTPHTINPPAAVAPPTPDSIALEAGSSPPTPDSISLAAAVAPPTAGRIGTVPPAAGLAWKVDLGALVDGSGVTTAAFNAYDAAGNAIAAIGEGFDVAGELTSELPGNDASISRAGTVITFTNALPSANGVAIAFFATAADAARKPVVPVVPTPDTITI